MSDVLIAKVDDAEVRAAFDKLNFALQPGQRRRVMASLGRYGKSSTQLRFRAQVDPDGKPWRPSQRALKRGGQTLRKTSRLRNSIAFIAHDDSVEWGTNVKYARVHQEGYANMQQRVRAHQRTATKAWGKKIKSPKATPVKAFTRSMHIPSRAFLGISTADRAALLKILADSLPVS